MKVMVVISKTIAINTFFQRIVVSCNSKSRVSILALSSVEEFILDSVFATLAGVSFILSEASGAELGILSNLDKEIKKQEIGVSKFG